jgi:hypothetical protein
VDIDVLVELKKKAEKITELSDYEKMFVLFSKSGFTDRLMELVRDSSSVILIDKDSVANK